MDAPLHRLLVQPHATITLSMRTNFQIESLTSNPVVVWSTPLDAIFLAKARHGKAQERVHGSLPEHHVLYLAVAATATAQHPAHALPAQDQIAHIRSLSCGSIAYFRAKCFSSWPHRQ